MAGGRQTPAAAPHPCLPVPLDERRRLYIATHLALVAMDGGASPREAPSALGALLTARELLTPRHGAEANEAVRAGVGAMLAALRGQLAPRAAVIAAEAGIEVYEQLVAQASLRNLLSAQAAARVAFDALLAQGGGR